MDNPGLYSLTINDGATDLAITAAGTTICEVVDDLDGMTGVTLQARLSYGSGGTSVKAYVQTSLDQGSSWIDVACFTFGVTSANKDRTLSALTPKTSDVTPTDGTLTDDTSVDGILGDRLRVKVVSTGTYAGSTVLSVRAAAR